MRALESPVMQITMPGTIDVNVANTVNTETPGPLKFLEGSYNTTPGFEQLLINNAHPTTGTWRLRRVEVVSQAYSVFEVRVGTNVVKVGRTSSSESTVSLPIEPWFEALPTDNIKLAFTQTDGPVIPVTGRIYYTEHSP